MRTTPSNITASLERSLQNFSLDNHHHHQEEEEEANSKMNSSSSSSSSSNSSSESTLELNSHLSLPYLWEQCLDLKTGEIYYINWRTGMKSKEDPRIRERRSGDCSCNYYSDDDSSCDSEETSSESFPASSSSRDHYYNKNKNGNANKEGNVLVVGGCKSCFMYFMVPKQVEDCPKCCGQLLHFDGSEDGGSS